MKQLHLVIRWFAASLAFTCAATVRAQTYSVLYSPAVNTGGVVVEVQGTNGNVYGDTFKGGTSGHGTIEVLDLGGHVKTLHSFDSADGAFPSSLIVGFDGAFYGTTGLGGAQGVCRVHGRSGCGTVFRMTPDGDFKDLHEFQGVEGIIPLALTEGFDGNYYGVTQTGGLNYGCPGTNDLGCGTIFTITPEGYFSSLVSFENAEGFEPTDLLQGSDGNFYGTAMQGGAYGAGAVFRMTPNGTLTTIYSFCRQSGCPDGQAPEALVQGADGNFYGVTNFGGHADPRSCNSGCGTVFKISVDGTFEKIRDFCLQRFCADGARPVSIIRGSDENFYGVTSIGGTNQGCEDRNAGCGTFFSITSDGTLTTLHDFCAQPSCADGYQPESDILEDTSGVFYGSTARGGAYFCGAVYSLTIGLPPFVKANPDFGKIGATVGILGTDLTGASSVSFNGVATAFRVVSKTFIEAKVPSGATTGKIQVVTPNGTLLSNVPFIVLR